MHNKLLGQHFLRCRWALSAMIHAAELKNTDTVLEVGPGTGVLTRALALHAGRVIAVEKDHKLVIQLQDALKNEGIKTVEIIHGDILQLLKSNLKSDCRFPATNYKLISNIPYYLTSRLIRIVLEEGRRPETIVFTIQKEVAQRIVAQSPHMNLLALSVQAFGKPSLIKAVPARCFSPAPKVDSIIIKIEGISDNFFKKNNITKRVFFETLRRAFTHKRKMLTSTIPKEIILSIPEVSSTARPEELSLEKWAAIVKEIQNRG